MGVQIERLDLPGIGERHDLLTESGRRVSVVNYRDGAHLLALQDPDDPDATSDSIRLSDDEAAVLAEVLGASLSVARLTRLSEGAPGLFTEHLELPSDSPYRDRPLGDTKARTRTRVSIVAIVRGAEVIPSPTPEDVLRRGDSLVAVGTRSGLDALSRLISHGPD